MKVIMRTLTIIFYFYLVDLITYVESESRTGSALLWHLWK